MEEERGRGKRWQLVLMVVGTLSTHGIESGGPPMRSRYSKGCCHDDNPRQWRNRSIVFQEEGHEAKPFHILIAHAPGCWRRQA